MGRVFGSLPDQALFDLAVAKEGIDIDILFHQLRRIRHPAGRGIALPERTGGEIHSRRRVHVRMSLQIGTHFPERDEVLFREKAQLAQHRIESRRTMSLGKDEPVAVRILRIFRIHTHLLVIQICHVIDSTQTSAGMTRLCRMRIFNDMPSGCVRKQLQFLDSLRCHVLYFSSSELLIKSEDPAPPRPADSIITIT